VQQKTELFAAAHFAFEAGINVMIFGNIFSGKKVNIFGDLDSKRKLLMYAEKVIITMVVNKMTIICRRAVTNAKTRGPQGFHQFIRCSNSCSTVSHNYVPSVRPGCAISYSAH
jgi:hypothetical protein